MATEIIQKKGFSSMSLIFLQHTGNESTNKNYLWRPHFLINTVWVFSCAQSSAFFWFFVKFSQKSERLWWSSHGWGEHSIVKKKKGKTTSTTQQRFRLRVVLAILSTFRGFSTSMGEIEWPREFKFAEATFFLFPLFSSEEWQAF